MQPFKLGDRISVSYSSPAVANSVSRSAWFEGVCEKVDLRYSPLWPPNCCIEAVLAFSPLCIIQNYSAVEHMPVSASALFWVHMMDPALSRGPTPGTQL